MSRRLLKQIFYGLFFFSFFSLIGYGFYNLSSSPSCFDNIQNGSETGIDCGGSCISCQIKNGRPLEVINAELLPIDSEHASLVINFKNPNTTHGAVDFAYEVNGALNNDHSLIIASGRSFIYPTEIKYVVHPALNIDYRLIRGLTVSISDISWATLDRFNLPKLDTRQISFNQDNNFLKVSGLVVSNDTASFSEVNISVLFFNQANRLVGASRTAIYDLKNFEERRFEITHPALIFDQNRTRFFVAAKRPGVTGISF